MKRRPPPSWKRAFVHLQLFVFVVVHVLELVEFLFPFLLRLLSSDIHCIPNVSLSQLQHFLLL